MAAPPKVTPQQIAEIMRRRAAGETYTAIGLALGFRHSTIARSFEKEQARLAAEQARAAADAAVERAWHDARQAVWDSCPVTFDPNASGPVYVEPEHCLAYWENRVNRPGSDGHHARRVLVSIGRGELVRVEDEATQSGKGRSLYLYPNGFPRWSQDEQEAA